VFKSNLGKAHNFYHYKEIQERRDSKVKACSWGWISESQWEWHGGLAFLGDDNVIIQGWKIAKEKPPIVKAIVGNVF